MALPVAVNAPLVLEVPATIRQPPAAAIAAPDKVSDGVWIFPGNAKSIEKRDERWTNRLEDVFAHVDRNHDGAIDVSELTSALPKPAQRPEHTRVGGHGQEGLVPAELVD